MPVLPKLYNRTKTPRKIILKSANIQRTDLYLVFLKLRKSTFQEKKKDLWCADEAFRIILLQRHNKFCGVIIFSQRQAIGIPEGKCDSYTRMMQMMSYESTRREEHGTHKHAHGSWILCSVSRVRSKTMHSLICITS